MFITVPLVFSPFSNELFEFPKMLLIYFYAAILGPLALYRYISTRHRYNPRGLLVIVIALFAWYLSQAFATVFSIDKHMSFFGYYSRFNGGLLSLTSYLVLFLSAYVLLRKQDVLTILKGVIWGGVLVLAWGIPAKFGHDITCLLATGSFSVSCWTGDFNPMVRLFSTIGQPNWYAAHLIGIALTILFYITTGKRLLNNKYEQYEKYGLIALFILSCIELTWTGSRAGTISFLIAITLYGVGLQFKRLPIPWIPLLAVLIPLMGLLIKTPVIAAAIAADAPVQPVTPSSEIRLIVWKGAATLIQRHPLLGTGPETFAISYNSTRPVEHNMTSEWDFVYNKAHNEFLNIAATSGMVGFASYLLLLLCLCGVSLYGFIKARSNSTALLALLVLSLIVGLSVSNFFGFSTTTIQLYFYIFPALLLCYTYNNTAHEQQQSASKGRVALWILAYSAILIFSGNYLIDYFLADSAYAAGKTFKNQDALAQAYTQTASALSRRVEPVYLDQQAYLSAQLALYYSSVSDEKNRDTYAQQALRMNKQTLAGSPQHLVYWRTKGRISYVLSLAYAHNSQQAHTYLQQASNAFIKAETLAPTDPKNYLSHALIVTETDPQKSRELLQTALQLKPNYVEARQYLHQLEKRVQ